MNTQADILARLLRVFPSQKIKEQWHLKGRKDDVAAEIAGKHSAADIKQFAKENVGLTKQIIYFCKKTPLSDGNQNALPQAELVSKSTSGGVTEHFYLVNLVYDVVLTDPLQETQLKFLWPVRVVFDSDHFRVHVTIMEKNVASYFPEKRFGLSRKKSLEEWEIMEKICEAMGTTYVTCGLDLNKGIKKLWANDVIDALNARWKEAKDTTTKTMDKDCFLKKDNAAAYNSLIKAPLLKTAFKFLGESEDYPSHFWTDPTKGEVVISTFSENIGVAQNVITAILKHN